MQSNPQHDRRTFHAHVDPCQHLLNLDGALSRRESAHKLYQERVSDRFDLSPSVFCEDRSEHVIVALQHLERMLLISLRHCSVTHNVGEHYCSESALAFCQLDLPNPQISLSITFAQKRHQAMKSFAWLKSCAHTRTPSN